MKLRIKEWMELRNISQAQISAALAVSRATVSAWVEGRPGKDGKRVMVFPDDDAFEALCLFMECTPSDMLELQRRKTPTGLVWRDFRDTKRGPGRPPGPKRAPSPEPEEDDEEEWFIEPDPPEVAEEDPVEEVLLFQPEPAAPRSSDELLGFHGDAPLAQLREWLDVQLGQLRRASTPEATAMAKAFRRTTDQLIDFPDQALLRGWLGERLSHSNDELRRNPSPATRAAQGAYTRTLNKLDHYARQA